MKSNTTMNLSNILAYPMLALAALALAGTAHADDGTNEKRGLLRLHDETTVSIGAGGNVLVRGATVTEVESGDLTATTEWGGTTLTWDVDTSASTRYVDASGDASARGDIEVGDTVSFSGMLAGALSVAADTVRDWSRGEDEEDRTHLAGTVKSVASGSFVVETARGSVTVDVGSGTDFRIGKDAGVLADLESGMKVRVEGEYDGDEFSADSVTAIALNKGGEGRGWGRFFGFFEDLKLRFR